MQQSSQRKEQKEKGIEKPEISLIIEIIQDVNSIIKEMSYKRPFSVENSFWTRTYVNLRNIKTIIYRKNFQKVLDNLECDKHFLLNKTFRSFMNLDPFIRLCKKLLFLFRMISDQRKIFFKKDEVICDESLNLIFKFSKVKEHLKNFDIFCDKLHSIATRNLILAKNNKFPDFYNNYFSPQHNSCNISKKEKLKYPQVKITQYSFLQDLIVSNQFISLAKPFCFSNYHKYSVPMFILWGKKDISMKRIFSTSKITILESERNTILKQKRNILYNNANCLYKTLLSNMMTQFFMFNTEIDNSYKIKSRNLQTVDFYEKKIQNIPMKNHFSFHFSGNLLIFIIKFEANQSEIKNKNLNNSQVLNYDNKFLIIISKIESDKYVNFVKCAKIQNYCYFSNKNEKNKQNLQKIHIINDISLKNLILSDLIHILTIIKDIDYKNTFFFLQFLIKIKHLRYFISHKTYEITKFCHFHEKWDNPLCYYCYLKMKKIKFNGPKSLKSYILTKNSKIIRQKSSHDPFMFFTGSNLTIFRENLFFNNKHIYCLLEPLKDYNNIFHELESLLNDFDSIFEDICRLSQHYKTNNYQENKSINYQKFNDNKNKCAGNLLIIENLYSKLSIIYPLNNQKSMNTKRVDYFLVFISLNTKLKNTSLNFIVNFDQLMEYNFYSSCKTKNIYLMLLKINSNQYKSKKSFDIKKPFQIEINSNEDINNKKDRSNMVIIWFVYHSKEMYFIDQSGLNMKQKCLNNIIKYNLVKTWMNLFIKSNLMKTWFDFIIKYHSMKTWLIFIYKFYAVSLLHINKIVKDKKQLGFKKHTKNNENNIKVKPKLNCKSKYYNFKCYCCAQKYQKNTTKFLKEQKNKIIKNILKQHENLILKTILNNSILFLLFQTEKCTLLILNILKNIHHPSIHYFCKSLKFTFEIYLSLKQRENYKCNFLLIFIKIVLIKCIYPEIKIKLAYKSQNNRIYLYRIIIKYDKNPNIKQNDSSLELKKSFTTSNYMFNININLNIPRYLFDVCFRDFNKKTNNNEFQIIEKFSNLLVNVSKIINQIDCCLINVKKY